jgi:DNA-binding response OmpR family regulator
MVVDDHPMWRAGVARDLEEAGYEVVAAVGEGGQAVGSRPRSADVVVLDLQLPDLSGVEVIRGLLASGSTPMSSCCRPAASTA